MAHLLMAWDGLPEGMRALEQKLDRFSFGQGVCRLREVKFYDLQFPDEWRGKVIAELARPHTEYRFTDLVTQKHRLKEAPFKHGKVRKGIYWFVRLFGGFIGLKPVDYEQRDKNHRASIPKSMVNVYALALADDNWIFDKVHNKEEECL